MGIQGNHWDDIKHYFSNDDVAAMRRLVEYIIESGHARRLHAITIDKQLVISIENPIVQGQNSLTIGFDTANNQWLFKYQIKPNAKPEFDRQYAADKGLEKFSQFLEWARWK